MRVQRRGLQPTRSSPHRDAKNKTPGESGAGKLGAGKSGKSPKKDSVADLASEFEKMSQARKNNPTKEITKRRLLNPEDLLVKCDPVVERVKFGGAWVVYRCCNAFSGTHNCTAAFCNMCFLAIKDKMRTEENQNGEGEEEGAKEKRRKSGRHSDKQGAGSSSCITVVGGAGSQGGCGRHTYADLLVFTMESVDSYCRRRRKKNEDGWGYNANNCWECGKVF